RLSRRSPPGAINPDFIALLVALVWALNPLLTASVTYISQRAESLMGLCYLATLYCFIRAVNSAAPRSWQVAAVVICWMGMAVKEVMITAPVVCLLYDRFLISMSLSTAWR